MLSHAFSGIKHGPSLSELETQRHLPHATTGQFLAAKAMEVLNKVSRTSYSRDRKAKNSVCWPRWEDCFEFLLGIWVFLWPDRFFFFCGVILVIGV